MACTALEQVLVALPAIINARSVQDQTSTTVFIAMSPAIVSCLEHSNALA